MEPLRDFEPIQVEKASLSLSLSLSLRGELPDRPIYLACCPNISGPSKKASAPKYSHKLLFTTTDGLFWGSP